MEATGPYYLPIAMFLTSKKVRVAVINPLVIKRFAQMRMMRTKTDKADASLIAEYGYVEKPKEWRAPKEFEARLQQLNSCVDRLNKIKTMTENQLHAFRHSGVLHNKLEDDLLAEIEDYKRRIKEKEAEMGSIIENEHNKMKESLESIPGIGPKTATLLILATRGFDLFENYKQVLSYLGLAPRIYSPELALKVKPEYVRWGWGHFEQSFIWRPTVPKNIIRPAKTYMRDCEQKERPTDKQL